MAIIHTKNALAQGGLTGMQLAQRDWSPYVVHFTNWAAMANLRRLAKTAVSPSKVKRELDTADQTSFGVVQQIAASGRLLARAPSDKGDLPACVCFSECNIAGLIAHSERYGRFGFVFLKADLFGQGARPCLYVDKAMYTELSKLGRQAAAGSSPRRLYGLCNLYRPPAVGGRIQDFTHEREWRIFADVDLTAVPPRLLLAPQSYLARVAALPGVAQPIVPLDMLFEWGA